MGLELNEYQIQKKLDNAYHNFSSDPFRCFSRGNSWFVDPANGDDNAGGRNIWSPVQTIQQALTLISNNRTASGKTYREYIYLLPGQGTDYDDDTVSASLSNAYVYINISDISIVGCGRPGEVVIKPDAAATAGIFALGTSADRLEIANITFDCSTAANECIDVPSGGVDSVWIHDCRFVGNGGAANAGIVTANAASCSDWIIEDCFFYNLDVAAIKGYLHHGIIRRIKIVKTVTAAMTDGISLLDNTTTADSDGCIIEDVLVLGGIEGTTPLATGIKVAAACYGVGIWRCAAAGCTDNLSYTANTAAAHGIENYTSDGRNGGAEYADSEDKLNS